MTRGSKISKRQSFSSLCWYLLYWWHLVHCRWRGQHEHQLGRKQRHLGANWSHHWDEYTTVSHNLHGCWVWAELNFHNSAISSNSFRWLVCQRWLIYNIHVSSEYSSHWSDGETKPWPIIFNQKSKELKYIQNKKNPWRTPNSFPL